MQSMSALTSLLVTFALGEHDAADGLTSVGVSANGEQEAPVLCGIGDLHGDPMHARRALRLCGAVDTKGTWIGKNMIVVQVGDVFDRGNKSVVLLDWLLALREQAAAAGGELKLLLGNHELMNLQGATYYVHPTELAEYGGEAQWRAALDPTHGDVGRKLMGLDILAVRGHGGCRTLFNHAGLRSGLAESYGSVEKLNRALHRQA